MVAAFIVVSPCSADPAGYSEFISQPSDRSSSFGCGMAMLQVDY